MIYEVLSPTGEVVNRIEWDGVAEWQPPDGHTVRLHVPTPPVALSVAISSSGGFRDIA
jgi:hypothetical protein